MINPCKCRSHCKYLGVELSSDLFWDVHIAGIIGKALQISWLYRKKPNCEQGFGVFSQAWRIRIETSTIHSKTALRGPEYPNPGQPYSALFTTVYLPDNADGYEACSLLKEAFEKGLLFTIGKCLTTGEENKIVWNDIELKTSQAGGPANYGYPDPSYLDRLKNQLAAKGMTQP